MRNMKILAIDPGETCGFAVLKLADGPELIASGQFAVHRSGGRPTADIGWLALRYALMDLIRPYKPDAVVIEDYRIYAGKANLHIGQHLFTAELIGAICYLCATMIPQIPVFRLSASKKGRWPEARLDAKFPQHRHVERPHAHDALVLGLTYLEGVADGS